MKSMSERFGKENKRTNIIISKNSDTLYVKDGDDISHIDKEDVILAFYCRDRLNTRRRSRIQFWLTQSEDNIDYITAKILYDMAVDPNGVRVFRDEPTLDAMIELIESVWPEEIWNKVDDAITCHYGDDIFLLGKPDEFIRENGIK